MLEWFDRVGYNAELGALERDYGIRTLKLAEWVAKYVRPWRRCGTVWHTGARNR